MPTSSTRTFSPSSRADPKRSRRQTARPVLFLVQNLPQLARELVAGVGLRDQIDAAPELPHGGVLGITGGEQNSDPGDLLLRHAGQFGSPQGARHYDISKEQVYRGAAFDNHQTAVGVFRSQHAVAEFR